MLLIRVSRLQDRHATGRLLRWASRLALLSLAAGAAFAATLGTVVPIGGLASDLALDEQRSVVYVANYTANRIDVVSTKTNALVKSASWNVSAQPSALALSPSGRYLVITHLSNFTTPANGMTIIDLTQNTRQTFSFGSAPLGVAFGSDGLALVVTTTDFLLLDPATGYSTTAATFANVAAKALPVDEIVGPRDIIRASVSASQDLSTIWGTIEVSNDQSKSMIFKYDVRNKTISSAVWTSAPINGPRVVSVNKTGSSALTGWGLYASRGYLLAQFPDALGKFGVGGHVFDNTRGLIYAQVPSSAWTTSTAPVMTVVDSDNLTVRFQVQLPENLSGRAVLNSTSTVMYAVSDSGLTILPVGTASQMPLLATTQEDIVFRGQFCNRNVLEADLDLWDVNGNKIDFSLDSDNSGVSFSPSSGTTPAKVKVSIDMSAFANNRGTSSALIKIASAMAVNLVPDVRVLVNNREPDQRGTFVDVPGKIVDIAADPARKRVYVLRQDKNQVLVYDTTNFTRIATLRTGNTPWSMTITTDHKYLITGADNSQVAHVFNLDTLKPYNVIVMPGGHYPRSVAASRNAVLAASRVAGPKHTIDRLRVLEGTSTTLASLGVWSNSIDENTMLAVSPSGASILAAEGDGTAMLYSATADTFVSAVKPATTFSGAVAAVSDEIFVIGNTVFNQSLGTSRTLETATGLSSGFALADGLGLRTTAPDAYSPGVIQRVDFATGLSIRPTRMVEAPLVVASGSTGFYKGLATLADSSAIVSLSTSGFTVLAWQYDAAVAYPQINSIVSAADGSSAVAPGGLFSLIGTSLSPTNIATNEVPLPTALGDSCMTINGELAPLIFVSPTQVNGQVPFTASGEATLVLRTPAGVSNSFEFTIQAEAPSVFVTPVTTGSSTRVPTIVRAKNNLRVTLSNPIHLDDRITIYATGLGAVSPAVESGAAGPASPLALAQVEPTVTLGGVNLTIEYAGLAPGQVGVYQINAIVPFKGVSTGMSIPLRIVQGTNSTTLNVRVVNK
jgi:uncharacterized protein (TIGR03437 family)